MNRSATSKNQIAEESLEGRSKKHLNADISKLILQQEDEQKLDSWEQPVPFDEYELPTFPTHIFTNWLNEYVEAVAEATQTPKDMASMAALAVLSIATAKKFEVNPYGAWVEPLNTYTITLMGSANRKSAVFELMTHPIHQYEKDERERLKVDIRNRQTDRKVLEKRLEYLISDNAKKPNQKHRDEIKRIEENLEELPEIHSQSFIIDDITPESLHRTLVQNRERIGILSAEGGIFEIIRGRYSKVLNMDIFLKGHSGDYARVDRSGSGTTQLESPALTIGIFAQPDVIQKLPNEFNGRGLLARFLYSIPKDFRGYREIRPNDLTAVKGVDYSKNIWRLMELDERCTQRLTFMEDADIALQYLQADIEIRLQNEGDLSEIQAWGGKIVGQLARIAALLHVAKHIPNGSSIPLEIEEDTVKSILELREYFISHAKAAFGCMRADKELEDIKYVLSVVERKAREMYDKGHQEEVLLSYRDIQMWTKKRITKAVQLKLILQELEECGHIRQWKDGRKKYISVNPAIYSAALKKSRNTHSTSQATEPQGFETWNGGAT